MTKRPPFLPTWLLKQLGCSANNNAVLGDLAERYQQGKPAAWYWKQTLSAIVHSAIADLREHKLLALRAVLGAVLIGACAELFVSRNLESLTYWLPSAWWSSETFRRCFEILVVNSIALLNGILGGWTAVRLYRRRRAVLLSYIVLFQIAVMATVTRPGFHGAGSIVVADSCFVLGAVAGGLLASKRDPVADLQEGDLR